MRPPSALGRASENIRKCGSMWRLCCLLSVRCWQIPNFSSAPSSSVKQGFSSCLPYSTVWLRESQEPINVKYSADLRTFCNGNSTCFYIICIVFPTYVHIYSHVYAIYVYMYACMKCIHSTVYRIIHCIEPETRKKNSSP